MDGEVNPRIREFFKDHSRELELFLAMQKRVRTDLGELDIKVQKTQISFVRKRNCVLFWLPPRKIKGRPEHYLIVSFVLPERLASGRIVESVEPYPQHWMHHLILENETEIDGELMGWLEEACHFAGR